MNKKTKKNKKQRSQPKLNRQIPNSLIRATKLTSLSHVLLHAREYPIHGCWIMAGWADEGITPVVVSRATEPNKVMFAVFMVDIYCLGVKDAYVRTDTSLNKFNRELPRLCAGEPEKCSVELAHEVVYGALEYAEHYGFQPHPDFKALHADLMLDPPDAHPRREHVAFGKDGKPFFISGPYDGEYKSRLVIDTLMRTAGEGNFDYITALGAPDLLGDFDDDDDEGNAPG